MADLRDPPDVSVDRTVPQTHVRTEWLKSWKSTNHNE